jgi:hypothetical protein
MLFLATMLAGSFVLVAFHYWKRLADHDQLNAEEWHLFVRWISAGLLVPAFLWIAYNFGFLGPPVWPTVAPISAGWGAWWGSFSGPAAAGIFFISSYWAGITFVWLLGRLYARTENRRSFARICLAWSLVLVPAAVLVVYAGKWPALGMALMLCGIAMLHTTLTLKEEKPLAPSYARAQARISFGTYEEAEMEVIRELEQCEEDFDGWMMLAELYATHFNDVPAADQTIRDLCQQPSITPVQVGIALNRLADWHLKLAHDPVAARQVLEQLCVRLAGTHMERMARQRINQLPPTREALLELERGKPLTLPRVPDELDSPPTPRLPREQAVREANECVAALTRNPDDVPTREKFAHLLADSLGERKTGIEQLELLLALSGRPPHQRAEWLLTMAGWHALDNPETARLVYQEVIRDFPGTVQACTAQRRLNLIRLQSRLRQHSEGRAEAI